MSGVAPLLPRQEETKVTIMGRNLEKQQQPEAFADAEVSGPMVLHRRNQKRQKHLPRSAQINLCDVSQ